MSHYSFKVVLLYISILLLGFVARAQDQKHPQSDPEQSNNTGALQGNVWHVEAGFTGRLAHNAIAAGNQADAALMVSGQGPLLELPFHLDVAFTGTIGPPHDLGTGWEETFTLYGFSAGIGETWLLGGDSWYYNFGGGLGLHVGDLRYRDYSAQSPDNHETATFVGAYMRGNLMYRVSHTATTPIYIGIGAMGQGTSTTHLLGKRLSDSGASVGLFVGIGL